VVELLGPAEIRGLAAELDVRPTKKLGQNFVHDPNTVRRIVELAQVGPDDVVLEVGPGLGSLTLGLLATEARVVAVEIDPVLAGRLPKTVDERGAEAAGRLTVVGADALRITAQDLPAEPTTLVANLPYNVAVPVLLHLLATLPSLRHGLVMVQKEVADRLTAGPGSKIYGVPSAKLAWYADARPAGRVPPSVFWPVPNVDSGLVAFTRREPPTEDVTRREPPTEDLTGREPPTEGVTREDVFAVIDAAFAQRRKTLRAALAGWAGGAAAAADLIQAAGIDPGLRGEQLSVAQFARIASRRHEVDRATGSVWP
jgi:16S rRNA (adenine1518-N6/adenine1519-N6)-dimethyltransferase